MCVFVLSVCLSVSVQSKEVTEKQYNLKLFSMIVLNNEQNEILLCINI